MNQSKSMSKSAVEGGGAGDFPGGKTAAEASPAASPKAAENTKAPLGKPDAWTESKGQASSSPSYTARSAPGTTTPVQGVSKRLYPGPKPPATAPTSPEKSPGRKVFGASERLTRAPKRRELPPIGRGKILKKDEQEGLVDRLYQMSLKKIQTRKEKTAQLMEKSDVPTKVISADETSEMVNRIFYNQLKHDQHVGETLVKKYIQPRPRHFLTTEAIETSNNRLYYESCNSSKARKEALYDKYVTSTNPTFSKMTSDEMQATTNRLSTKG